MQTDLNPENKCAHLVNKEAKYPTIEEMFTMQKKLQDFYATKSKALDLNTATFKERVADISVHMINLSLEFAELLERLPHKKWKTYSEEQLAGFTSEEHKLETQFEYIDMFHFFLNIGLSLGIDGETFSKLYYLKNKENFERQNRGY